MLDAGETSPVCACWGGRYWELMAIPSLLHPYNKLLTLKSAFPVRYEMLVESDEILRGGESHLCWLCLPRFPQIHLGLHHTPLVSSLPLRMPLCSLQDRQQCPRMGPRHWCPWKAHPWGEGDSETLDEMPLEACWALQKEQGCVWGTGLAFYSFGGTKLFLWSL